MCTVAVSNRPSGTNYLVFVSCIVVEIIVAGNFF